MRITFLAAAVAGTLLLPGLALSDPPPAGQLQTPESQSRSTVGDAASSPMHDLNVMRTKIPPILLQTMADPYARVTPATCSNLSARIAELTDALGDDLDVPPTAEENNRERTAGLGREAIRAGAESLIPFRGFVRKLSGADQHDKLVLDAITAGNVRRAYLKGLGEARGCRPPATPRHLIHTAAPVEAQDHRHPQYPIH
ncbi:MAG TPA: hypothetical protein VG939_10840 [Caulobacteraceae bacterium]|nr:hypothetical protein [Caulobacteraceae bacterium]